MYKRQLDEHRARATITDSAITTALEFEFNRKGEIIAVYTPARYREVSGEYLPTPWQGRFSNYINVSGNLIPQQGEVEWLLKDQVYPYWKARIQAINYD